jgi:hypothetical protein
MLHFNHMIHNNDFRNSGWLIFFYSVPSKPVSNRMKIWRRLAKAGALPFKGAVYILPASEEHYEFFQWLIAEAAAMGGEGAFVRTAGIESMKNEEILRLFHGQKKEAYHALEKKLDDLDRKVNSIRKGSGGQGGKGLKDQFIRMMRDFEEIRRTDFFTSAVGEELRRRIKEIEKELKGISGPEAEKKDRAVEPKKIKDYQEKRWVSRKKPFVDRMASAWLIKTFVDPKASFDLMDEAEMEELGADVVTFDVKGGEFTHIGDMCTFEVLIKAFRLKSRALGKIAEIVHELDINDEKYHSPEAQGIKEILTGIRKSAEDDREALEKGMIVFGMLLASKT